tara:strand:- start:216 stop:1757 length:1542 start_codon:yes stop_codon:yes gene_type:complete
MPAASFAKVLCTTTSANNAFDTSAKEVFDVDLGSVVFESNISDDIFWNQSVGTFTFRNDGTYHIVANLITESNSGLNTHTITFALNSGSAIYTGAALTPAAFDPLSHTHQRIISVSAGDILHIKGVASANKFAIVAGSSLIINKITSGVFASSTVSTAGTNNTTSEFNPLDTDGDGPAFGSTFKVASGITFAGAAGSMTVPSAGRYFIMVNNLIGAAGSTNSNNTIHIKSGSTELYTIDTRVQHQTDAEETTICFIEDLAASAVLTMTWDIGSGNCFAAVGTTFTVYRLNDDISNRQEALDFTGELIAVVNKASSTASAAEINPFDEDNYSSADFDTRYANGITFASSDGTFTIGEKGTYWIFYTAQISTASDATVTTKIKVNGTAIFTSAVHIDSLNDPMNRTHTTIVDCEAGASITTTIDSNSPNIQHLAGSSITIIRVPDWAHRETTPDALIAGDFTINTQKINTLSRQYDRMPDQVPFVLGTRGPLSLRGRSFATTETPPNVSTGEKKN